MPISLNCPGCRNKLNAPDSAAGKRVKCPKCQNVLTLPAPADDFEVVEDDFEVVKDDFEVVDDDTPPPKKKSKPALFDDDDDDRPRKKRPVSRYEDDDDEDDEDDEDEDERPRKKAKKKSGSSGAPVAMLIGGGMLLLIALGVGGYFLFSGGGKKGTPSGTSWTKFDAPDQSFTAYFPNGAPTASSMDVLSQGVSPQELEQGKKMMEAMGMKIGAWEKTDEGREYFVFTIGLPPLLAAQLKPEELTQPIPKGGKGGLGNLPGMKGGGEIINEENTSTSGQTSKQILAKDKSGKYTFMRVFFAGGKIVMIGLKTDKELKTDDAMAKEFFNKFEWKAK